MIPIQNPPNDNDRIRKLHEYRILDTPSEPVFDDLVSLAAMVCAVPMAMFTLIDRSREWYKAKKGIPFKENPRVGGFGAQTILQHEIMTVSDARGDPRFSDNSLVTSEPWVRFYAGVPVRAESGEALGVLCVLDKEPRNLSAEQLEGLRLLARQTAFVLEFRLRTMEKNDTRSEAGANETSPLSLAERSGRQYALRFARAVIEALPLQFCVLDKNGRILEMNRQWQDHERDSGYYGTETGQDYLELVERGRAKNRGGKSFAKGMRAVLSGEKEDFSLAYQDRNTRGVPQWFIGKVMPFPDQELAGIIVVHEDITDLKLLEHRFRQLVESSPSALVMVNENGIILMVNAQTEMSFGYSRNELIGQPVELLIPERFRSAHVDFRKAYAAAPVSRPMGAGRDLYARRKDGSEFPVEIGLGLIDDENGLIVLSSIIDITERIVANDKLKQALNEKEILLKEVYHRVKNNLQVVSSMINLQARNVKHDLARDLLQQSADRVKSMALLHEKLYQSKDLTRIDFKAYVHSLVDYLLFGYGDSSARIRVGLQIEDVFLDVDTAIPCGLIINELLSNALKHAFPDNRPGRVDIAFRHDQNEYVLEIADNGIGFPPGLDFKKSSSLGLQLVTTLTNQLLGHIRLDRNHGSIFSIRFDENSGH